MQDATPQDPRRSSIYLLCVFIFLSCKITVETFAVANIDVFLVCIFYTQHVRGSFLLFFERSQVARIANSLRRGYRKVIEITGGSLVVS